MNVLVDGQTLATPDIRRGIGRVFIELCAELVSSDQSRQWYFAVESESDLEVLGEEARRFAIPLVTPTLVRERGFESRSRAYSRELAKHVSEKKIGLYWNPNPLMLNVILPLELTGVRKVCTVYDLIPLMLTKTYRDRWSTKDRDEYDARVERLPDWADHMVFISESSRDDYQRIDSRVATSSSVVDLGVDRSTFWAPAIRSSVTSPPYVLTVAGSDPRKNAERAIEAFAEARKREPRLEKLRFEIVAGNDRNYRRRLSDIAKSNGVSDFIRIHDFLEDETLAVLYRQAAVFFFPSLYEGFGFPVVEAMACGVPVVISDRPELRYCGGEWATVCDPLSIESMANALVQTLLGEGRNEKERPYRVAWAEHFDWAESAFQYAEIFDRISPRRTDRAVARRRQRTAWVSPWPPERTGIADYSADLVGVLGERMDIDLFLENPTGEEVTPGLKVRSLQEIPQQQGDYDAIVYHLGNNARHHSKIYRMAWEVPGVAVLHDFNIHAFLQHTYVGTADEWLYRDALADAHGDEGLRHFEAVRAGLRDPDIQNYPLSQPIASRCRSVVVHSAWVREALGSGVNSYVVPLLSRISSQRSEGELAQLRDSLGLKSNSFVVGIFGFLNRQKRVPVVLESCARLRDRGYRIELLMVGSTVDPHLRLAEWIDRYDAADFTTLTDFVTDEKFDDYLDASDVVMNLRYPTMGESSLSLARALGAGKPCLVTDVGQFSEIPDSVCWKAEVGRAEVEQVVAYLEELLGDPELRRQLGASARRYARNYLSPQRAARLYESVLGDLA